jgi:hypothetical protein
MNAFTPIEPMVDAGIDPKLAWLACAAARFELVEAGAMDIDTAFDGLVVHLSCSCSREMVERWERDYPYRPKGGGNE